MRGWIFFQRLEQKLRTCETGAFPNMGPMYFRSDIVLDLSSACGTTGETRFQSMVGVNRENTMHLKGKSAIVTGAGRGIGRDIALLLAKEGASVIVNDPGVGRGGEATTERPADDVVAEIKAAGGKAQANYDSVTDYQKAGAMVRRCVEDYGKIDILVNVAGMLREKMIWNMSEDD